jgi:hypothetical protein
VAAVTDYFVYHGSYTNIFWSFIVASLYAIKVIDGKWVQVGVNGTFLRGV